MSETDAGPPGERGGPTGGPDDPEVGPDGADDTAVGSGTDPIVEPDTGGTGADVSLPADEEPAPAPAAPAWGTADSYDPRPPAPPARPLTAGAQEPLGGGGGEEPKKRAWWRFGRGSDQEPDPGAAATPAAAPAGTSWQELPEGPVPPGAAGATGEAGGIGDPGVGPGASPIEPEPSPEAGEADGDPGGSTGAETDEPPPDPLPDRTCPACGTTEPAEARFCEACGTPMDPAEAARLAEESYVAQAEQPAPAARPCVQCGGSVAEDGYCTECGAPAASERDHFRIWAAPWLGGVCDRGLTHSRNEDALAIELVGDIGLLVVCDGVSSAPASDEASLSAVTTAVAHLRDGLADGSPAQAGTGVAPSTAWAGLLTDAISAANEAVLAVESPSETDAPSCTFVGAAVDGDLVVVASVGDSRAYWLPDSGPAARLTKDDSWLQEMIDHGMTRAQAQASPQANAITRWLGADAPELAPHLDTLTVTAPGWLMLCSDGLYMYQPEADGLRDLVAEVSALDPDPVAVSKSLVDWAHAAGGRDNVTVALARLGDEADVATPADATDTLPTSEQGR